MNVKAEDQKKQPKTVCGGGVNGVPLVTKLILPDGRITVLGQSAAARHLGCTPQAFSQLVKGTAPYENGPLGVRVRALYPELF